jgi:hypothetical protein
MTDDYQDNEAQDGATSDVGDPSGISAILTDEHQNAIGGLLQHVADQTGLPLGDLLGQVGLNASDVSQLSQGDLLQAAQYLMQNHPELVQEIAARVPALQGLLGLIGGASGQTQSGDLLGGLLGRVLGGS